MANDSPEGARPVIFTNSESGQAEALLNSNLPKPGQRYALAHQLCHFVLHGYFHVAEGLIEPKRNWASIADDPPYAQNAYEAEADIFAVNLLIPQSFLQNLPRESRNLDHIETTFEVPRAAAVPAYNFFLKNLK